MFVLDTDFIFSYFDQNQSTHLQSVKLIEKYGQEEAVLSNLTKQELATVISYKVGYQEAKDVIKKLELFNLKEYFINDTGTLEIWKLFWQFNHKKISFVDCTNLYLAKKLKLKIASFDAFYPKEMLLSLTNKEFKVQATTASP
ncbi:MAG: PIN domain-containing protein [bacterium]